MDELMSCLFLPSPPRIISLSLVHSKNTTEMTAMIETLSFLGPHVQWLAMSNRVLNVILSMFLVFAWARSRLVHMCSWHSHVNGPCYSLNTGYDSPCKRCMVTVQLWVKNVLIMPRHWVATHWVHHNFDASACYDG